MRLSYDEIAQRLLTLDEVVKRSLALAIDSELGQAIVLAGAGDLNRDLAFEEFVIDHDVVDLPSGVLESSNTDTLWLLAVLLGLPDLAVD